MDYLTSVLLGLATLVVGTALIAYGISLKPRQRPLRRIK